MENRIYVGNLSYTTGEDDLRKLFEQAGTVTSVAIITDRDTGRSKGFGFIEMATQAEAQKAIGMFNGSNMEDRALTVSLARPREERGPRGGGGGGGGFDDRRRDRPGGGGGGGGSRGGGYGRR
jgi:cold-inducible RNA-binding protein